MLFPVIKVIDVYTGCEHIVGTNSHDALVIDKESGGIQYVNMQNEEGTKKYNGESEYEFMGLTDDFEFCVDKFELSTRVKFVSFQELASICAEQTRMDCLQESKMQKIMKELFESQENSIRENGLDEEDSVVRIGGRMIPYEVLDEDFEDKNKCIVCGKYAQDCCDICDAPLCEKHKVTVAYDTHVCPTHDNQEDIKTAIKNRIERG